MGAFHPLNWLISAVLWGLIFCAGHYAFGREAYPGQYAQVDPETRAWFGAQKVPGTNHSCCGDADGTYAEEDIRPDAAGKEHYWVRFEYGYGDTKFSSRWMQVPDEVVIHNPNRHGAPVVWWWIDEDDDPNGELVQIRCFAPGAAI